MRWNNDHNDEYSILFTRFQPTLLNPEKNNKNTNGIINSPRNEKIPIEMRKFLLKWQNFEQNYVIVTKMTQFRPERTKFQLKWQIAIKKIRKCDSIYEVPRKRTKFRSKWRLEHQVTNVRRKFKYFNPIDKTVSESGLLLRMSWK